MNYSDFYKAHRGEKVSYAHFMYRVRQGTAPAEAIRLQASTQERIFAIIRKELKPVLEARRTKGLSEEEYQEQKIAIYNKYNFMPICD